MFDFIDSYLANTWILLALLISGFFLLVKGADWLVDGASGLAKRFNVSDLIIGLTVVAFGTSMPEFVVNMISASQGNSELAITNILGSNAINIFVILGITALIWPIGSTSSARKEDIPIACIGAALIFLFACITLPSSFSLEAFQQSFTLRPDNNDYINALEGVLLFLLFAYYMVRLTLRAKNNPEEVEAVAEMKIWKALILILVGLAGLTIGGELCVKTATQMAHNLGVSDAIIGLTVVALGTSLPELATSAIAAIKHNTDLALGNCIGSCTFNIFFVLSLSAMIHPLQGYAGIELDAFMAFAGPALVWLFVKNDKNHQISRLEGAILLILYAIYLGYRLFTIS